MILIQNQHESHQGKIYLKHFLAVILRPAPPEEVELLCNSTTYNLNVIMNVLMK